MSRESMAQVKLARARERRVPGRTSIMHTPSGHAAGAAAYQRLSRERAAPRAGVSRGRLRMSIIARTMRERGEMKTFSLFEAVSGAGAPVPERHRGEAPAHRRRLDRSEKPAEQERRDDRLVALEEWDSLERSLALALKLPLRLLYKITWSAKADLAPHPAQCVHGAPRRRDVLALTKSYS